MNLLNVRIKNQASVASQCLSDTVFLDSQSLCYDFVDQLAEAQRDWIGMLGSNWEIDASGCSLNIANNGTLGTQYLTIQELVSHTQQLRYELLVIEQEYWVYTICLRIVGLGRVRLVFSFDNPQQIGKCAVLATNRLDWSPRRILTQWFQSNYLDHKSDSRQIRSHFIPIDHLLVASRPRSEISSLV